MPHDKDILPHTISSLIKHQETGLIAAGVPPQDARIFAHETFYPTEIEHPISQEDSEDCPSACIQIPWVESEIEPVRTRSLLDRPTDPLAGLESLYQHTGDISSLEYQRPGNNQTSLYPMEIDRAVIQWKTYIVPVVAPEAEPDSTPVPPSLVKLMEDLHAAGITQEILVQTCNKYMGACAQHGIAPRLFSEAAPYARDWNRCKPLNVKKRAYLWMLRESRVYRTIMKILQPENMLEMHKLLVSPRVTVDADWEGIGDSGAPADWEDLRDEDLNSLGFKRSETTQIEFDENETEAWDVLEPLGYWETLRDVEQLFKHTGPLDKYYLPEETTPLYLPDEPWADSTWEEMALPIIGSACPDLSSALKLERLRSLAEAGISKEMLQETESNYLPLCKRFAVSPWFFERDIPNVARLRQHQPEATPGNYVWIQNESRVYQLMVRLLVRGYSDLISVNTGTSLFIQYQRPFRTPAEIRRQKALSSKDLWSFKLLNTHALDNLTRQVWLSMEYGTIYHFEACVVIRPPRLPSYVGRRKTELLGSSDIYWHKERKLEALRTLLPDLITYFAFKRLSVHSQSGSVQLRFFLKETSMRDIDLSDSLVRDRLDQLTDRRVQSLPPIKKPDGLEELGFEHHRVPEWDEGEMYSIPDEAWEYYHEQD